MTRSMLTGLAAALLAVVAAAPADAQGVRQQGGAYASQSGGNSAATGGTSAQPQGSQRFRNSQRNAAMLGAHQAAYAYQLRRKQLDAWLPVE